MSPRRLPSGHNVCVLFSSFLPYSLLPLDFLSLSLDYTWSTCTHTHARAQAHAPNVFSSPTSSIFPFSVFWKMLQQGLTVMRFKWVIWPETRPASTTQPASSFSVRLSLPPSMVFFFPSLRAVINAFFQQKLFSNLPPTRTLGGRNKPCVNLLSPQFGRKRRSIQRKGSRSEFKSIK